MNETELNEQARSLRQEIELCLRSGPAGWLTHQAQISPAAIWLVNTALASTATSSAMADFANQFSRDRAVHEVARQAVDMLRCQANAEQGWQSSLDPDIQDAFPGREVIVVIPELAPADWKRRWTEVGGLLIDGRAVALQKDKVWSRFSHYGLPYPPFEWGAGLDVTDLDYDESADLGLL